MLEALSPALALDEAFHERWVLSDSYRLDDGDPLRIEFVRDEGFSITHFAKHEVDLEEAFLSVTRGAVT